MTVTGTEPVIRPLARADVLEQLDAFVAVAADVPGEYWDQSHFVEDRPAKWDLSCAAWSNGRPVGYAIVSERAPGHAHLHHFMVVAKMRGSGLGQRLAGAMISRAASMGYLRLTLKVAADNHGAHKFYRKLGFAEAAREDQLLWFTRPLQDRGACRMTTVAIHQPNYAPWLGYFHKMARADHFVFLDDVQFSKGSYINRVQVLGNAGARWLTQPVTVSLGIPINQVTMAKPGWVRAHLDTLRGAYRAAGGFAAVWPDIEAIYGALPRGSLATVNRALTVALAARLGVTASFSNSSAIATGDASSDARLVAIVGKLAPGGAYLSGKGGGSYQDPAKFAAAGIALEYTRFDHPAYDQGRPEFIPGLSVLDAVFHLGWSATAALVRV